MNRRINFSGIPAGNPFLNGLLVVGGVLAFAALLLFSLIAFVVIASVIIVLAGIVAVRLWWQGRKLSRGADHKPHPDAPGNLIEGEYRRVPPRRDEPR